MCELPLVHHEGAGVYVKALFLVWIRFSKCNKNIEETKWVVTARLDTLTPKFIPWIILRRAVLLS